MSECSEQRSDGTEQRGGERLPSVLSRGGVERGRERAVARVGTSVGRKYVLLGVLGAGGMGAVYEAVHEITRRRVAVKLLHRGAVDHSVSVARLFTEAQAASAIGHPGIVEVLDAGRDDDGTPYIVLERLEGDDLLVAIDTGEVTPAFAVRVAREVLDALAAAHARGFVHRDIKPENIFLLRGPGAPDAPRVKLLDFGVAMRTEPDSPALTTDGAIVGTPYYMSPEQARGARVDARADLWSLGATLFHALAGRPPYDGANYNLVIADILHVAPPSLASLRPEVPPALAAFVDRALSRSVEARFQSALEMAAALDEVAAQLGDDAGASRARATVAAARAATVRTAPESTAHGMSDASGGNAAPTMHAEPAPAPPTGARPRVLDARAVALAVILASAAAVLGGRAVRAREPGRAGAATARAVAPRAPAPQLPAVAMQAAVAAPPVDATSHTTATACAAATTSPASVDPTLAARARLRPRPPVVAGTAAPPARRRPVAFVRAYE